MPESLASHSLTAELLPRRGDPVVKAWRFVLSVFAALFGETVASVDLVVRRRDTGAEVMRTPADVPDPEHLLETVREDLATKTITEFFAEWRLDVKP